MDSKLVSENMDNNELNTDKGKHPLRIIGKFILVAILLATLVFVVLERENFLEDSTYVDGTKIEVLKNSKRRAMNRNPDTWKTDMDRYQARVPTERRLSMQGDVTILQRFIAQDNRIDTLKIYFHNPAGYNGTGKVVVSLLDKNQKKLATTDLETNLIANDYLTMFSLTGNSESYNSNIIVTKNSEDNMIKGVDIEKGEPYYISIESQGVGKDLPFDVYLHTDKHPDDDDVLVNGKAKKGEHIFMGVTYRHFTLLVFSFLILIILMALALVLLPLEKISRKLGERSRFNIDLDMILSRMMFLLTPLFCYYAVGKIADYTTVKLIVHLFSLRGVLNLMIIGLIWWIIYALSGRTKVSTVLTTLIFTFFGMINYLLILWRDSPLIANDILNIGTAMDVAKTYHISFNKSSVWLLVLSVVWICVALSLKNQKALGLKKRIVAILVMCAWAGLFNYVLFHSDILEKNEIQVSSFRPKTNFRKNGWVLSFMLTVTMTVVDKPDDYSVDRVRQIADRYQSDPADKVKGVTKTTPNIIVVMNEAYSDIMAIKKFKVNRDYMPFFNSLKEDTIRGTMHTSVFGGQTADTEFEFLTGYNMQFMPFHSVPYTNRLGQDTPSLTWALKERGYGYNKAMHPGMSTAYNRDNAYPHLGFDDFISLEDMDDPEMLRSYVSDEYDFDLLEEEYEEYRKSSKDPFYAFNVTIQNHGDYKIANGLVKAGIAINEDFVTVEQAEQYLNLIKKTDDALEGFIKYFQAVEEPTVVVFFGDHQPMLDDDFYDSLYGKKYTSLNLEESESKYRVPFIIWANYDIEEETGVEISPNYLAPYMLQKTGGRLTGFDKYLLELHQKMPVLTDIGCMDAQGNIYSPDDKECPLGDLINEYQNVQYNGLIDHENRINEFFYLAPAS